MALHSFQQWDTTAKGEVNSNVSGVPSLEYIVDNQKDDRTFSGGTSLSINEVVIPNEETQIFQQTYKYTKTLLLHTCILYIIESESHANELLAIHEFVCFDSAVAFVQVLPNGANNIGEGRDRRA
jgi:hypothetical protein